MASGIDNQQNDKLESDIFEINTKPQVPVPVLYSADNVF